MYEPREARRWGSVALIVLYVPICSHKHGQLLVVCRRRKEPEAHRVNLEDGPEPVLGQVGDRREEVPSGTCSAAHGKQSARVVFFCCEESVRLTANDEVDSAVLLDGLRDGILQELGVSHIRLQCDALATGSGREFLCTRFEAVQPGEGQSESITPCRAEHEVTTHFRPTIAALAPCFI